MTWQEYLMGANPPMLPVAFLDFPERLWRSFAVAAHNKGAINDTGSTYGRVLYNNLVVKAALIGNNKIVIELLGGPRFPF